ncbi:MAG: hypothetical protein II118_06640 [Ruminococcus sp.]|jgi:hypothetical protein|nr:hypothetical protein [Ruminococcus sp.]MBQ1309608.1 hypothetical protein [Ruminococcus sp.]MBQ1380589.1 hypothetical protein [Ruminococcus sp.]MBQ1600977.1 hypothetical protein [Ruminococcus sp.]MBQ1639283.1 hypothetical protein [Ruminococcus sp.]
MINDAEMLTYILQSAEMGCQGIKHVREGKCSRALDTVLCNQMARYGKIYSTAGSMLKNLGEDIHRISPLARKMAQLSAARDLRRDPSGSHIAEMMIKGNTMGVNKMAQHLRDYDRTDPNVTLLAKKMLDVEQAHIGELRSFL